MTLRAIRLAAEHDTPAGVSCLVLSVDGRVIRVLTLNHN